MFRCTISGFIVVRKLLVFATMLERVVATNK